MTSYPTPLHVNNAVASKYGKCWYEKLMSQYGFDMKNSLMEDERNYKAQKEHTRRIPKKAHPTSEFIMWKGGHVLHFFWSLGLWPSL